MKLCLQRMPSGNAYERGVAGEKTINALGVSESHLVKGIVDVAAVANNRQRLVEPRHMSLDQLQQQSGHHELRHCLHALAPCSQNLPHVLAAVSKAAAKPC